MQSAVDRGLLDARRLERFARSLATAGDPIANRFSPGLSEPEIAKTTVCGHPLPTELQRLWAWHDGAEPAGDREHTAQFGAVASFVSLDDASGAYEAMRSIWGEEWFPVAFKSFSVLVCDCSGRAGDPCRVRVVDTGTVSHEPVTDVALPSLGSLISLWTEALDRGFWKYDATGRPVQGEPWPELDPGLVPFVDSPDRLMVD